ncbi:MAG: peptidase M14 [Planctomycetes bacterium]|nr:peptidase M14 [Planctomycetota bacterium]
MIAPLLSLALLAQDPGTGFIGNPVDTRPSVEIAWNRLYDDAEIYAHLDRLAERWPDLLTYQVIGKSVEGREMRVYTLNDPASGSADSKPAMWVDANVHGNEVQGSEATLYLAWYLLENHGTNERVDDLLGRACFYILPMVNPDGRHHWIHEAHNPHSSRTGHQPTDSDLDGKFDEDPPNDLDGDGHIVQMRKYVPGEGTHRLDPDDPRVMIPVPDNDRGEKGDWILLGTEGYDDDGDGLINEDDSGGYDMNRAWPSSWRPGHIQYGAGPYPLYWPETRCIADFILAHPNIAAVQSFHNTGGMILRGPGAESYGRYPRADLRVYDELGKDGERMLPFYDYMIIWKDLYSVFGGFVNWTYEGLGIISFTNEMWVSERMFPQDKPDPNAGWFGGTSQEDRLWFNDQLMSGGAYIEWHEVEHPLYGTVEVGGFRKDFGRVPPSFLIEEELHRNAVFCMRHAESMPDVVVRSHEVSSLGGGLTAIDVTFENLRPIPTRTALAAQKKVGKQDEFTIAGDFEVLAGGFREDRWRQERMDFDTDRPERLLSERGIPGRGEVMVRWIVRGSGTATVGWTGEKGREVRVPVELP